MEGSDILSSMLVSGVGFIFFSYGRKMSRAPQLAGGLVLMTFPYFVSGALSTLALGAALVGVIWFALRLGH